MPEPTLAAAPFDALTEMAGPEFVEELVETFLEEAPTMITDLKAAAAAGDADRFRRAAHSLKSNGNTFGALELGRQAKVLELGGLASGDAEALAALDAEYARVVAALKVAPRG